MPPLARQGGTEAGHTLLALPERAVSPLQRPEEPSSCPVATLTIATELRVRAAAVTWLGAPTVGCQKLRLLSEGHKVQASRGQLPTARGPWSSSFVSSSDGAAWGESSLV